MENHTILLLAGGQGLGKTSWLRNLVPPELRDYLFTGNVNPYSKGFPQMMVDCLLIVIDEMSGQSYADLNRLKALTSTGVIYLRRPYGHYAETQIRHASFAATVNDLQSLPDDNESRRFLCFEATRIDYQSPVRHADIYAQALALLPPGREILVLRRRHPEDQREQRDLPPAKPRGGIVLHLFPQTGAFRHATVSYGERYYDETKCIYTYHADTFQYSYVEQGAEKTRF